MRGLNDDRGTASLVLLLILFPLFLVGILLVTEQPRWVHGTDPDLGRSVAEAARYAAMSVDAKSQAHGDPRIDPDRAHDAFRQFVSRNVRLAEPYKYILVVYNGPNEFDLPETQAYVWEGGTVETVSMGNVDGTFAVGDFYVVPGLGERSVTLDRPGCVAVVRANIKPTVGEPGAAVRWASAQLVIQSGANAAAE